MMSLYKRIFPFLAFMSVCGCQLEALHVNGDECSPSFSNGMSVETGSITCYKDHMAIASGSTVSAFRRRLASIANAISTIANDTKPISISSSTMHHRPTAFSSVASTTRPTSTLIDRFSTTANSMYAPPTRRAVRGRKTTMAPLRLLNASHVKTIFAVINASISNLTTRIAAHVVENARVERLVENPNASAHQTSFSAIIIASIPKQIINFVAQAVHVKAIIAVRHAGEIKSAMKAYASLRPIVNARLGNTKKVIHASKTPSMHAVLRRCDARH